MDKEVVAKEYISKIIVEFKTGQAREHSYRPALKQLFESVMPKLQAINDPKQSEHGAPDFVLMRSKELSAGYVEAKDVDVNLDEAEKSEQMQRYLEYGSLILTNYLEFRFFKHGKKYDEPIIIAAIKNGEIVPAERKFADLQDEIKTFLTETEPITSSAKLAKIMGDKARRIRNKVFEYVSDPNERNGELRRIFESFKQLLIHDIKEEQFADMYAQTLVYGLFTARYEDETPKNFSRGEARELIPPSNPFLRGFFDHIAGANFDTRLKIIVNELCEIFQNADVNVLMNQYVTQKGLLGEDKKSADPVIHFYEDFLKEYDPELRKKMGAYYTPLPVVDFIVRSVDHILQKDFGLAQGLADTTKLPDGKHKVQILDPAVGTGTFISEIIDKIYASFTGQTGRWAAYVHGDLLPRIHGFELMMTPYTIAHLKIGIKLAKTGFTIFHRRLGIYLTNSLEQTETQQDLLSFGFAENIAEESKAASIIKNDTPIMVVIGNPPYSGESSNAHYTGNDVYKVEPTGGKLKERNPKWLNDDYVKFISFAESLIEKNGEGIVGMITAHGYLDNPTFRGMRWHLLNTFDEIYVFDLHGNANKKEKALDGLPDKNVFDIKQGVAIFVGVKTGKKKNGTLAKVFRTDILGERLAKYEFLNKNSVETVKWQEVIPQANQYVFEKRDVEKENEYKKGFSVSELFPVKSVGVVTSRDDFVIADTKEEITKRINDFLLSESEEEAKAKFHLRGNKNWKIADAIKCQFDEDDIRPISYRPFDIRWIYYNDDFIERMRRETMNHFLFGDNLAIVALRQVKAGDNYYHIFCSKNITESTLVSNKTSEIGYIFPLYLYNFRGEGAIPNFAPRICNKIIAGFQKEAVPEDIFDYIYAVLHSPSYREKYKEFLKIDFPRVPYPKDEKTFWKLVELGRELRGLHLLESPKVNVPLTTYSISGDNKVEEVTKKGDKVFINKTQYFGGIPDVAWNFYIGGYQPAQKWLKDRKGRTLTNADIEHYQKIIIAIVETGRIMKKIDEV